VKLGPRLQPLVRTVGPGQEPASTNMANTVQWSGEAYMTHNREMQGIVQAYITNLTSARNEYVTRDEVSRDTFHGGQR
jgi:hypothetical protein